MSGAESDIDLEFGALTVVADPHGGHFDYERWEARRRLPRYPRRPDEVASALEEAYGSDSLLTRSAKSLANVTESAEETAEPTLDSASAFTNRVLKHTGRAFGVEDMPEFRFKSRASTRHFGIRLEAKW